MYSNFHQRSTGLAHFFIHLLRIALLASMLLFAAFPTQPNKSNNRFYPGSIPRFSIKLKVARAESFCDGVTEIPKSECEALEAFYNSTNGPNWIDHSGWMETNAVCSWYRVSCEIAGHVTYLDPTSNGLTGPIPSEIGNLTELKILVLSHNQITTIPSEIGSLIHLEVLDFSNTPITSIPPQIGNLSSLKDLRLISTRLTSLPPEIGNLSSLVSLQINSSELTSLPPELSYLRNLQYLNAESNHLTSIPREFENFAALQYLMLAENQINGPIPYLSNLSNIVNNGITLHYNKLYTNDDALKYFLDNKAPGWANTQTIAPTNLEIIANGANSISLSWDPIPYTGDGGYYEVSYAPADGAPYIIHGHTADKSSNTYTVDNLTPGITYYFRLRTYTPVHDIQKNELWSDYTSPVSIAPLTLCESVTEIPQSECESLVTLFTSTNGPAWHNHSGWLASNTPCSWEGLSCSSGHVVSLVLYENGLEGTLPPELGNLSALKTLRLSSNYMLTGTIPSELGNLSVLEQLYLDHNVRMSGPIPRELGNLAALQTLALNDNKFSGTIPPDLARLTNLKSLYLSSNRLTGSVPAELGALVSLKKLNVANNQLSGSIPPQLGNMHALIELSLNNNDLNGSIPRELGDLSALQYLFLSGNDLSGSIPPELGNLSNLHQLDLCYNVLSGLVPLELINLTNLWDDNGLLLGYNMLFANNPQLTSFLDKKAPGWDTTQTLPPKNLTISFTGTNEITLSWSPIIYNWDGGFYEVSYSQSSDGPYSIIGYTADKSSSTYVVENPTPGFVHYFRLRTYSPTNISLGHDFWSEYTEPISITIPTPPSGSLSISKTGPGWALPGGEITYTLTVTNLKSTSANNVVITDALPMGASYVRGGTLADGRVHWAEATLPGNSTRSYQFVVTATSAITNSVYGVRSQDGSEAAGSLPVVTQVSNLWETVYPDVPTTKTFTSTLGGSTTLNLPAGAVTNTLTLVYTSSPTVTEQAGFAFAGLAFEINAYHENMLLPGVVFQRPVTMTLEYTDAQVSGLDERNILLSFWDGERWVDAANSCNPVSTYIRQPEINRFAVCICHLSRFAVLAPSKVQIFLPLSVKAFSQ